MLRVIWDANAAGQKLLKHRFTCFADLMEVLVENKDCFDLNLLAVMFWMIWEKEILIVWVVALVTFDPFEPRP